ncbi:MAG: hypothetical protein Q8L05_04690 [Actinomycetota bacterium]|nr:hypothetical protein [Actinomycetota bacterium]MDP2287989.1 hypothetical protein [Actinomycetota bacterium]
MNRVLILVMATSREPWAQFQRVQLETWGTALPANVSVLRYFKTGPTHPWATRTSSWREALRFGRRGRIQRFADHAFNRRARRMRVTATLDARGDLEVPVPDFIHWNGVATIAALKWVLANGEYDFILRVNSSAYVNTPALLQFIATQDASADVYAGSIESGQLFWGTDFANGAAVLLSRNLAMRIVDHADTWDHRFTDDVSLGVMAADLGTSPVAMPVMRISTSAELENLTADTARSQVAIRLKSTELPRDEEARMRRIQQLLPEPA